MAENVVFSSEVGSFFAYNSRRGCREGFLAIRERDVNLQTLIARDDAGIELISLLERNDIKDNDFRMGVISVLLSQPEINQHISSENLREAYEYFRLHNNSFTDAFLDAFHNQPKQLSDDELTSSSMDLLNKVIGSSWMEDFTFYTSKRTSFLYIMRMYNGLQEFMSRDDCAEVLVAACKILLDKSFYDQSSRDFLEVVAIAVFVNQPESRISVEDYLKIESEFNKLRNRVDGIKIIEIFDSAAAENVDN